MLTVRRGVAAVCLMLALGSGCGSDDDTETATGGAGATASTSVSADTGNRSASTAGGSGSGSGSGSGKVDACTVLSDQEAGAALGGTVLRHGPASGPGESVCEWEIQGDYTVTVSVGTRGTAPGNKFKPDAIFSTAEAVPQLGPDGGWYIGLNTVEFAAGERRNSVQVVSANSGADKNKAIELAVRLKDRIR